MTHTELQELVTIPEAIWEVTFQLLNGDWEYYRTGKTSYAMAAIDAVRGHRYDRALISIQKVG